MEYTLPSISILQFFSSLKLNNNTESLTEALQNSLVLTKGSQDNWSALSCLAGEPRFELRIQQSKCCVIPISPFSNMCRIFIFVFGGVSCVCTQLLVRRYLTSGTESWIRTNTPSSQATCSTIDTISVYGEDYRIRTYGAVTLSALAMQRFKPLSQVLIN